MKTFPSRLTPQNINDFSSFHNKRQTYYLKKMIYEWMISPSFESRCFDLQMLPKYHQDILDVICKELNELGWKTKLAFANSALYIYKEDENPCRWEFEEM
jgi:hypothetical protein